MNSIYQRVLGSDFRRLHPEIQRRFGFSSVDNVGAIGRGVMEEIWKGRLYTVPFLYVGAWRRIMFPETGRNIPFTIENYAFVDRFGRETVSWVRTFQSRRSRRFDAYMIYSEAVDVLSTTLARTSTWPLILSYPSMRKVDCVFAQVRSASTKGLLRLTFR